MAIEVSTNFETGVKCLWLSRGAFVQQYFLKLVILIRYNNALVESRLKRTTQRLSFTLGRMLILFSMVLSSKVNKIKGKCP